MAPDPFNLERILKFGSDLVGTWVGPGSDLGWVGLGLTQPSPACGRGAIVKLHNITLLKAHNSMLATNFR